MVVKSQNAPHYNITECKPCMLLQSMCDKNVPYSANRCSADPTLLSSSSPSCQRGSGPPFAVLEAGKRCSADPRCSPLLPAWNLGAPLPLHLSEHTLDCTRKLRSLQKEKIEGSRKRQAALLQGTHHKQTTEKRTVHTAQFCNIVHPRIPHPLLLRSTGHWGFLTGREEDGERRQQMSSPTRKISPTGSFVAKINIRPGLIFWGNTVGNLYIKKDGFYWHNMRLLG